MLRPWGCERDGQALLNADVNKDGKVNANDALLIAQYINGDIKSLPVLP